MAVKSNVLLELSLKTVPLSFSILIFVRLKKAITIIYTPINSKRNGKAQCWARRRNWKGKPAQPGRFDARKQENMQTNEDPKAAKNGLGIAALSAEKVKNPIGSRTHEGNAIAKADNVQ